jgi:ribosomal protein L25 (general stress protein Ctc)
LSIASSGLSGATGSFSNTSSAAPAIRPARSASISAVSSTIGPRATLMKYATRLHLRELRRADQVPRLVVQQAAHHDEIRFGHHRVEMDLARAEVAELDRIDVGIGGEQHHVERARHTQNLLADAPCTDDADRAPGEPHAHVVHPLVPASRVA